MQYRPLPNLMVIKISKESQASRKEKMGALYLHVNYIWMTRNCQAGEIVAMHPGIKSVFPEVEIGDTAILHHFVESVPASHFLHCDKQFNYYIASFNEIPGRANEVYGIIKNGRLIPSPDYVFLQKWTKSSSSIEINQDGGLLSVKDTKSRSEIEDKMKDLTIQIQNRCRAKMNDERRKDIIRREKEIEKMSEKINGSYIEKYKILEINKSTVDDIEEAYLIRLQPGDSIMCANFGCLTEVEINGEPIIMGHSKHIYFPEPWAETHCRTFTTELLQSTY